MEWWNSLVLEIMVLQVEVLVVVEVEVEVGVGVGVGKEALLAGAVVAKDAAGGVVAVKVGLLPSLQQWKL
jgi:hypothetical protein